MKYVVLLIGVLLSFVLGYLMEPGLRDAFTGDEKESGSEPVAEEVVEPESLPDPEPEPDPEPVEEEGTGLAPPSDNEIRQIMYESIRNAEIKHFDIGQVTHWKEYGEEEINGTPYQFGLLDYREPWIFGEREFEAKALILDGKVEKWIWTVNGMPIP